MDEDVKPRPQTFGTIELVAQNTRLLGYVMSDWTYEFVMRGRLRSFPTLQAAWEYWTDTK